MRRGGPVEPFSQMETTWTRIVCVAAAALTAVAGCEATCPEGTERLGDRCVRTGDGGPDATVDAPPADAGPCDGRCVAPQVCDEARAVCVDCVDDSECAEPTGVCVVGECVACRDGSTCVDAAPACRDGACVSCETAGDCDGLETARAGASANL